MRLPRLSQSCISIAILGMLLIGCNAKKPATESKGEIVLSAEPNKPEPIILQCAAALREPIAKIVIEYEQQKDQRIEVRYGASQKVLTDLKLSKQGDLFLPADDSYIVDAQKDNLLDEVFPLVTMNAAVAVKKDCGKKIEQWSDLHKDDIRVAIANPEGAALSRLVAARLGSRWAELHKRAIALGTVTQVANAIKAGQGPDADRLIHAGIIWDYMVKNPNYNDLKVVKMPELEDITATIKIGVVKGGQRTAQAKAFAMYLSTSCADIFKDYGFTPLNLTSAPKTANPTK